MPGMIPTNCQIAVFDRCLYMSSVFFHFTTPGDFSVAPGPNSKHTISIQATKNFTSMKFFFGLHNNCLNDTYFKNQNNAI